MKRWMMYGALLILPLIPVMAAAEGEPINNHSKNWDTLWHHVLIDLWAIGIVFGGITIIFLVVYKRKRDDQEGDMPALSLGQSLAWCMLPAFLFLADDFFLAAQGWKLWNDQRRVPENALEVKGLAYFWDWTFEYENGATSDNDLYVPAGRPVVVRSVSEDVVHALFIPEFRIKEDIMPGRTTYIWFYPEEAGKEYILTCTEYCGNGHSDMFGLVKVLSEEDYEKWLEENA